VDFACGEDVFIAKKSDNSCWGMGLNQEGQLGLGHLNPMPMFMQTLQPLALDAGPAAIGCGSQTTFMMFEDGSLWCWGLRLGAPKRQVSFPRARQFMNSLAFKAAGKRLFDLSDTTRDLTPHKLATFGAE
jgi:alpha-tubulin suppressor-like RCC1 family protein